MLTQHTTHTQKEWKKERKDNEFMLGSGGEGGAIPNKNSQLTEKVNAPRNVLYKKHGKATTKIKEKNSLSLPLSPLVSTVQTRRAPA